ncbi:MAG TPA: fluoride efflux transporter CrcB [Marmoricola sp.]|nr:fluoride efflux transporter CrcB [Marmoricola sp.]
MPGRDPRELLAVFVGGAVGAVLRAALDEALPVDGGGWPWPTFLANLVACFALGYLATRLLERLPPSEYRRPFLGTGVCGGLSTFSTFQVEAVRLVQAGAWPVAAGYVVASLAGGLLALHLATAVARRVVVR